MIDFSEVEAYYGPLAVEDLDAAVAAVQNADSAPDATHTDNLITSAAVANAIVRPNLLDNWYFKNAVNQRGKTTGFNTDEFTIDRWKLKSGTLTVSSPGLTLNGTLTQILENAIGMTVTASALLSDGTMLVPTYDDTTKTFTLTATGQTIVAAKLELGSVQTLAHQDSGTWILNEIPNFPEQLARCQRYYYRIQGASYLFGGCGWNEGSIFFPTYFLPVPMCVIPTATASGSWKIFDGSSFKAISTIVVNTDATSATEAQAIMFRVTASSSLTSGKTYYLLAQNDSSAYIELSTNM